MSNATSNAGKIETSFYFVIFVLLFLAMFKMMSWMGDEEQPQPIDGVRAQERSEASEELIGAAQDKLENYTFLDEAKGQVRLPIRRAMEIVVEEWQDPAAGRAKLITRWEHFNPPPPPPPPEAPSEFE